ncbi:metallophosphoesterase family protein [Marinactinospora thermotolerans]|uniref:Predicted phosphoesterases, related to the Icc protein n=1 Tax=Marinactinospora thermotolerans DSM 45154 TaxID=1122192 RepID=A0A1T4R250_9ACTN|nr:metallophosphoesterase [Marinactinospora thermotolerans]SKA09946.1 Predicted phosphoesterases, related to the Icc protein [Marinactinospora thermotolerans DSM 45154]
MIGRVSSWSGLLSVVPRRTELAGRVRRWRGWRVAVVLAAALLGGWLGLALGGHVTTPVGPADVRLSVSPSWHGETVVDVAPLGRLEFDTHAAPLRFEAAISEIRLAAAQELFENPEAIPQVAASIGADLEQGVIRLFVRAGLAALIGATLAALVLFRDLRRAGWSALTALLTLAATGGATYATFNPGAISEPRYTGLLAGAPQVVGSAEDVINHFSEYSEQLAGLVGNVSRLYEVTAALPVYENEDDGSTIRVLHVSDIHLNPAAWDVIRSLKEQFQVDLIIDSGDLTDRGSAAEDVFADEIAGLEVPYVWIRGNHDSMGTQRAVESQENAIVLDDEVREVAGLRLYGVGDPRFTPDKTRDNPDEGEIAALGLEQMEATVAGADPPVDVAVIHDPAQARAFTGQVPLVLSGHGHRRWTELEATGTRYFVQGSTGGAGLRSLDRGNGEPTPYQASVLYFDAETRRLQAWDDVTLGGLGLTSAQIERHLEADPDRPLEPPATPPVTPSPSPSPSLGGSPATSSPDEPARPRTPSPSPV